MSIAEPWSDLEAEMLGPEPDYESEPPELPDLASVNRTLGRLARVRREMADDADLAESQIEQVQAWLAARTAIRARAEDWLLATLRHYHEALLAMDPSARTIGVPNGTLRARAGQPRWEIDAEQFLPWALALEDATGLVRTKHEPVKNGVKEAFEVAQPLADESPAVTPAGEVVPGVVVRRAQTSFTADTAGVE